MSSSVARMCLRNASDMPGRPIEKDISVAARPSRSNAPVNERFAAMDGVRPGRQPAVGFVQNERRGDAQRRSRALDSRDEKPVGGYPGPRLDRHEGEGADSVLYGREDSREGLRAMDHDELTPRLENCETSANPTGQGRGAWFPCRQDMGARPRFVWRGAHRAGVEERRIGEDRFRLIVGEASFAARPRLANVEVENSRPRRQSVAVRVGGGELRQLRFDLDKV